MTELPDIDALVASSSFDERITEIIGLIEMNRGFHDLAGHLWGCTVLFVPACQNPTKPQL